MEVVYFLISVIEIVLTCYLVYVLNNARKQVEEKNMLVEEILPAINIGYKKAVQVLKITSVSFKLYEKYKIIGKYISKIAQIKSVLSLLKIIEKKRGKKFEFIPILRKLLFFI